MLLEEQFRRILIEYNHAVGPDTAQGGGLL